MSIKCMICGKEYDMITHNHLKKHNIIREQYIKMFPDAPLVKESKERAKLFKSLGYDTLFIWSHEMKDLKSVINKILAFHDLPSLKTTIQTELGDGTK